MISEAVLGQLVHANWKERLAGIEALTEVIFVHCYYVDCWPNVTCMISEGGAMFPLNTTSIKALQWSLTKQAVFFQSRVD